jgi:hypothetical protein
MKKISIDLDGPNTSISSMETMPIEITPTLKYVNVFAPREVALKRWPKVWARSWAFG